MSNAPQPPPKWRQVLKRTFKWSAISGLMALVVILTLALNAFNYYAVDPVVTPKELYHRTWQAVRVNYYDQDKLRDWAQWEHKYDEQIHTEEDALRFAREMVESLNDPYTILHGKQEVQNLITEAEGKQEIIGVVFKPAYDRSGSAMLSPKGLQMPEGIDAFPTIDQVVRGSSAQEAGINPGDVLVSVNGVSTSGLAIAELQKLLSGPAGEEINLVVRQNGVDVPVKVTRKEVQRPIVSVRRLPGDIAYIRVESFFQLDQADQLQAALEQVQDCKGYIIDLRDNGGGFIHSAVESAAMFMDAGNISTIEFHSPAGLMNATASVTPGRLWVNVNGVSVPWTRRPNLVGNKPVVLLVNFDTASASELFASALQDNGRVHVIGVRTYGKGIGQTLIPVGNGNRLRVTNIVGHTPSGRWLGDAGISVRHGVIPDTEVIAPRNLLIGSSNDNQLRAAEEYIRKQVP
ncbi:MAG TPA: S41 family peptidase [Candidatus Melainabacteria bacterium]|nr:S41 family peptidase [Candidatus Melainabacteria bacterium]